LYVALQQVIFFNSMYENISAIYVFPGALARDRGTSGGDIAVGSDSRPGGATGGTGSPDCPDCAAGLRIGSG